jgi:hypothetical protein
MEMMNSNMKLSVVTITTLTIAFSTSTSNFKWKWCISVFQLMDLLHQWLSMTSPNPPLLIIPPFPFLSMTSRNSTMTLRILKTNLTSHLIISFTSHTKVMDISQVHMPSVPILLKLKLKLIVSLMLVKFMLVVSWQLLNYTLLTSTFCFIDGTLDNQKKIPTTFYHKLSSTMELLLMVGSVSLIL